MRTSTVGGVTNSVHEFQNYIPKTGIFGITHKIRRHNLHIFSSEQQFDIETSAEIRISNIKMCIWNQPEHQNHSLFLLRERAFLAYIGGSRLYSNYFLELEWTWNAIWNVVLSVNTDVYIVFPYIYYFIFQYSKNNSIFNKKNIHNIEYNYTNKNFKKPTWFWNV